MSGAELGRHVLLAVAVITSAAWLFGRVARMARQPRVLGEIIAGIALGPSLLGAVWPGAETYLFPPEVASLLRPLADLGLVLFMFLVGLELDRSHLRGQGHRAVVVSHTSIVLPFAGGALLAWWLHDAVAADHDLLAFCLFIGAAMAVTAFPVLARILQETGLDKTRVGSMALACASVDDVTAWCILAAVLAVAGGTGPGPVLVTIGATIAFGAAMWFGVRPLLTWLGPLPLPLVLAFPLVSAYVTDLIGIHAIFGAFLAGVVLGSQPSMTAYVHEVRALTDALLLPVFFMIVGLSTQVGLLDSAADWGIAALVIGVAVLGKLGGAGMAARLTGASRRDAATIGVLMNTRGLTEIVILTVGLERGIIPPTVFTMMVLMALFTTLMAAPLLRLLGVATLRPPALLRYRQGRPGDGLRPA